MVMKVHRTEVKLETAELVVTLVQLVTVETQVTVATVVTLELADTVATLKTVVTEEKSFQDALTLGAKLQTL